MSPKRILNVDLPYMPKCTEFFKYIFENNSLFQILSLTGSCVEGT